MCSFERCRRVTQLLFAVASISATYVASAKESPLAGLKDERIAAVVFPQDKTAAAVVRSAQSRLESILIDNGIIVLDRKKAAELKDVMKGLDDPTAFVTAETFMENAEKFKIKALAAIYLKGEIVPGLANYYTATAHADIRVIGDANAKVSALTTPPMGLRGRPPSHGLTRNSAIVNATYRAIDQACEELALDVIDRAEPKAVRLKLVGPVAVPAGAKITRKPANDKTVASIAALEAQRWRVEEATCTARSADGALGIIGGYIRDTDHRRRPPRLYGSRVHLVDIKAKRALDTFECSPVEKKTKAERGTKEVLDCMFVSGWRYAAAVTGNDLLFWDVETGRELSRMALPKSAKEAVLGFVRAGNGAYLVVKNKRNLTAYKIELDR
jgi:hypothetical protein